MSLHQNNSRDLQKEEQKKIAAEAAVQLLMERFSQIEMIGVGTGSTANCFMDTLAKSAFKSRIEGAVASSNATAERLKSMGISVIDLNHSGPLPVYIDGADEFNPHFYLIKGGGGALTREKIVATAAKTFICLVDAGKKVEVLGQFPVAVEVLSIARSFVAREITKLGGEPVYREGFVTDNGNVILDVYHLNLLDPVQMEQTLNNIPGVVCNGIFALRPADIILMGTGKGVELFAKKNK